jgi:hypothetical protein
MQTDKYGREGADIIGRFAASYKKGRGSLVCNGKKGRTVHSTHILVVFLRQFGDECIAIRLRRRKFLLQGGLEL